MKKSPLPIVEHKTISSGMSAGWHKNIAVSGILVSITIGVISQSISPAFMIFIFSSSIGLVGEAITIYKKGELTARRRFPRYPLAFVLIKKENHPKHFFFHIATFATLGILSFVIGAISLWASLT